MFIIYVFYNPGIHLKNPLATGSKKQRVVKTSSLMKRKPDDDDVDGDCAAHFPASNENVMLPCTSIIQSVLIYVHRYNFEIGILYYVS